MRLISNSEFYLCKSCRQYFLCSELLPYVGFFVISLGISLLFFTLVADKVGFGHPGVGPYEKIGFITHSFHRICYYLKPSLISSPESVHFPLKRYMLPSRHKAN
jgi:hypothetical protein